MMLMIISLIEIIYANYMYHFFKTNYSFQTMINEKIVENHNITNFLKHSIEKNKYESKICSFGKLFSVLFSIYIIARYFWIQKYGFSNHFYLINTIIIGIVAIVSYILNLNAFIYYIPIYLYEFLILPRIKI